MCKCILILSVVIYCALANPSVRYRSTNGKDLLSKSDYDYDFDENYDQRQTGETNIRFGLSNVVFALPGDLLTETSNEESLDIYDDINNSAATAAGNINDNEAHQIMLLSSNYADYLSKKNNNLKPGTGPTKNKPDKLQNDQNKDQETRFVPALRKFVRRWWRVISQQFVSSF